MGEYGGTPMSIDTLKANIIAKFGELLDPDNDENETLYQSDAEDIVDLFTMIVREATE
jgi:hypothetical protein